MSKKELNNNEIEKVSGGNGGEQKEKLTEPPIHLLTAYGGPSFPREVRTKDGKYVVVLDKKSYITLINKEKNENPEDKN